MLNGNNKKVFKCLQFNDYIIADDIAKVTNLSNKTVRNCIANMKYELDEMGVEISSKPRYGYKLKIVDEDKYNKQKEEDIVIEDPIPTTSQERMRYLMMTLFSKEKYYKIDELAEIMYVTRGTISKDVKDLEQVLHKYNLVLKRTAYKGIFIEGDERDKRTLLEEEVAVFDSITVRKYLQQHEDTRKIGEIVHEILKEYQIEMPEVVYLRLIASLSIQITRIRIDCFIRFEKNEVRNFTDKSWKIAIETVRKLEEVFDIQFSEDEMNYLYINFISKGIYDVTIQNKGFTAEVEGLVNEMLLDLQKECNIDFRHDFDLKMQLIQHICPLIIRIKYDFYHDNPMVSELRMKYPFAFNLASQSILPLVRKYNTYIPQEEVGYLALIFQLAIERKEKEIKKSNILIVCATGKGSSQLLKYKYKYEFNQYLHNVFVCDLYNLQYFDFSQVDYIFTTVPLELPLPIHEVSLYLDDKDVVKVKNVLGSKAIPILRKYYKEHHFISNVVVQHKFDAIRKIVDVIEKEYTFSEDVYDTIIKRENLASTEFGNFIAMPHSLETLSEETIVYVAILEEPIIWSKKEVQIVILTLIGKEVEEEIQAFYEATTNLFFNEKGIQRLIEEKSYDSLINLLVE